MTTAEEKRAWNERMCEKRIQQYIARIQQNMAEMSARLGDELDHNRPLKSWKESMSNDLWNPFGRLRNVPA